MIYHLRVGLGSMRLRGSRALWPLASFRGERGLSRASQGSQQPTCNAGEGRVEIGYPVTISQMLHRSLLATAANLSERRGTVAHSDRALCVDFTHGALFGPYSPVENYYLHFTDE